MSDPMTMRERAGQAAYAAFDRHDTFDPGVDTMAETETL